MTAPTLTDPQRAALSLAERLGWGVGVEAAGARVALRQGRPDARLVLLLGPAAWADDDRAARDERLNLQRGDHYGNR